MVFHHAGLGQIAHWQGHRVVHVLGQHEGRHEVVLVEDACFDGGKLNGDIVLAQRLLDVLPFIRDIVGEVGQQGTSVI